MRASLPWTFPSVRQVSEFCSATKPPRILQIKGTGAFYNKTNTSKLEFKRQAIEVLRPCDQVLPWSKIQPHSDRLLVTGLKEGGRNGLVFTQDKYSDEKSATTFSIKDVTNGLDRLLDERGVLFDVDGTDGTEPPKNQISKLGVKEEDVVYCWSGLRMLPKNHCVFF